MGSQNLTSELIAPCGMNCGICKDYLAYSRGVPYKKGEITHCSGCRVRNKKCAFIKTGCLKLRKNQVRFCFECSDMPCGKLDVLDKRYRERYGMSMVQNLNEIQDNGMEYFLKTQREKYRCTNCGDIISVHDGKCYSCNYKKA